MIVLLHGFMDSPHTWDLVRPYLGDDVLAPALPGHLGGPPLPSDLDLASYVEGVLDEAGLERAHLVGNSLGGYLDKGDDEGPLLDAIRAVVKPRIS